MSTFPSRTSSNPFVSGNPFLAPELTPAFAPAGGVAGAADGAAAFRFVAQGPSVAAEEVETVAEALMITVRWGDDVLDVQQLAPPRSFALGDGGDFVVPEELLGASRAPLVVQRGAASWVVVPSGASLALAHDGAAGDLETARAEGRAEPSTALAGATEVLLRAGERAVVTLAASAIAVEIASERAGRKIPVPVFAALAGSALGYVGLSLLLHSGALGSVAFFMPSLAAEDSEALDRDKLLFMRHMLDQSAERERELTQDDGAQGDANDASGGESGARHSGEEGAAGKPTETATGRRMAIRGEADKPKLGRAEELQAAREFGMIGILAQGAPQNGPTTKWGDEAVGRDDRSAVGNMWGADIGDAFGTGLGLHGPGEGGGGTCDGCIGIDRVGDYGPGIGPGRGPGFGPGEGGLGRGHGRPGGAHQPKPHFPREGKLESNGRLAPEVIQRIVRQNFGRFRLCYENGLRANPGLTGRIATRFVIDRTGAVSMSQDAGSDMPDQAVVGCVVRSFSSLSFPSPEGGVATVTYPITFSPGD